MKTDVPLQLWYGGLALLLLGPVLTLLGGGSFLAAKSAQNWPTVEARVVQSKIEVSKKASGFIRSRTIMSDYFTAAVEYEYVVDGKQYTADRIHRSYNPSSFDRSEVAQWTRKCPRGADLTVHYSPRNPRLAVIDPTPDVLGLSLLLGTGLLMIPAGLVLRRFAQQLQPALRKAPAVASKPAVPTPVAPVVAKPPRTANRSVPLPRPQPLPGPAFATEPEPPIGPAPVLDPAPVPRQMHFLLRTMAILAGLCFFFFGAIAFPMSAELCSQAVRAAVPDPAATVARFITMAIVGCMALMGAYLICKGTKGTRCALAR